MHNSFRRIDNEFSAEYDEHVLFPLLIAKVNDDDDDNDKKKRLGLISMPTTMQRRRTRSFASVERV
jgi:hypothetical protein